MIPIMVRKLSLVIFYFQMCFNAFDKAADLDVLDHPILNFIYYLVSLYVCVFLYCRTMFFLYSPLFLIVVLFKLYCFYI